MDRFNTTSPQTLATFLAAALLSFASVHANASATDGCGPNATLDPASGLCVTTTVSCIPPLLWSGTACIPLPAPAPADCEIRVVFAQSNPGAAVATNSPGCDVAGTELALAIVLARSLGAPTPAPCQLGAVTCGFLGKQS